MKPEELHRIHAANEHNSRVDFKEVTCRATGGDMALKKAMARRLAVCWNTLTGYPTQAIEAGCIGHAEAFVLELLEYVEKHAPADTELRKLTENIRKAYGERADALDWTNGRLHDCTSPECVT